MREPCASSFSQLPRRREANQIESQHAKPSQNVPLRVISRQLRQPRQIKTHPDTQSTPGTRRTAFEPTTPTVSCADAPGQLIPSPGSHPAAEDLPDQPDRLQTRESQLSRVPRPVLACAATSVGWMGILGLVEFFSARCCDDACLHENTSRSAYRYLFQSHPFSILLYTIPRAMRLPHVHVTSRFQAAT